MSDFNRIKKSLSLSTTMPAGTGQATTGQWLMGSAKQHHHHDHEHKSDGSCCDHHHDEDEDHTNPSGGCC